MAKAKLILIPNTLGAGANLNQCLPPSNVEIVKPIRSFVVEHIKDARRFLVKIGLKEIIDQSEFFELNKHTKSQDINEVIGWLKQGKTVGLISDAGCPAIADPGAIVVKHAHQIGADVVPLVGPSSILLALMASGFNGQSFSFIGYLPQNQEERIKLIRKLEGKAKTQTQLFIETPYRNVSLLKELTETLNNNTLVCVACDVSLETEWIKTLSIAEWKRTKPVSPAGKFDFLKKRPCMFLIGS